jgi:two-component system OmpR family response regulator
MPGSRPVLVVEDDPDVRDLLSRRLVQLGYRVLAAATGEEAVEMATASPPSLVVLDIRLPGIDGWEVLRRLRLEPTTAGAAVLVVSVLDPHDDQPAVDGYVTKPFRIARIDELVAGILAGRGSREPGRRHDGATQP